MLRPVSEWATHELAVALSLSSEAAQGLLERSLTLVHRLPATLDALEAGVLHPGHLWPLLDKVAPIADDTIRARLEADLLAWAARRGTVCTPAQLGDKARREVLRRNLRAAADDLVRAIRKRGVSVRPDRCDGMAVVSALLTVPEAAALMAALGAYADALPADRRSRGQKMADCLRDLVLRPGESGLPPVQVSLSVIAPLGALLGGEAPCEIDGHVVPAEVVRALLTALTGHRLTDTAADDSAADAEPTDTATTVDEDDPLAGIPAADAAAYAAEADALAAWWDRIERRLAAGEFDRDPGPDDPDDPGPDHSGPDGSWPPDLDWPSDSGRSPDDDPASPAGDGWWARADAAVTAASDAVLTAQQALGHARRLVATAARADTTDHAAWAAGPAGRITAAPDALGQLAAATDQARQTLTDLLGATAGGGLTDRPRLVLTHALTGALVTLTDAPALHRAARSGTGLTVPAATDGYRPGAALDRHVRARDRRCRFPGCRRRVPAAANSTTTPPGRQAPPPRATSPATAPATTAASTKPPAGDTTGSPTAPSPSPHPPASPRRRRHPRTDAAPSPGRCVDRVSG